MYVSTLGPSFDMAKLQATAKVLTRVQRDNAAVSQRAKLTFHRIRPWAADPTLKGCTVGQKDNSFTSYPSGHTEVGFALGVTLAYLIPDKAQAILMRANDYAYSRMVCGVHFRSDTVAGQALATAVTFDMLRSPKMQADLKAAHAELESAGF